MDAFVNKIHPQHHVEQQDFQQQPQKVAAPSKLTTKLQMKSLNMKRAKTNLLVESKQKLKRQ